MLLLKMLRFILKTVGVVECFVIDIFVVQFGSYGHYLNSSDGKFEINLICVGFIPNLVALVLIVSKIQLFERIWARLLLRTRSLCTYMP